MAAGTAHDAWTIRRTPLVALASGFAAGALSLSPTIPLFVAGGFLFGGLYLSPDLDTPSRPFYRWKMLRWYWLPYQKLLPHRSPLSHTPIVGSAGRLLYLLLPLFLASFTSGASLAFLLQTEALAVVVGVVLSELLHLYMDGLL